MEKVLKNNENQAKGPCDSPATGYAGPLKDSMMLPQSILDAFSLSYGRVGLYSGRRNGQATAADAGPWRVLSP